MKKILLLPLAWILFSCGDYTATDPQTSIHEWTTSNYCALNAQNACIEGPLAVLNAATCNSKGGVLVKTCPDLLVNETCKVNLGNGDVKVNLYNGATAATSELCNSVATLSSSSESVIDPSSSSQIVVTPSSSSIQPSSSSSVSFTATGDIWSFKKYSANGIGFVSNPTTTPIGGGPWYTFADTTKLLNGKSYVTNFMVKEYATYSMVSGDIILDAAYEYPFAGIGFYLAEDNTVLNIAEKTGLCVVYEANYPIDLNLSGSYANGGYYKFTLPAKALPTVLSIPFENFAQPIWAIGTYEMELNIVLESLVNAITFQSNQPAGNILNLKIYAVGYNNTCAIN